MYKLLLVDDESEIREGLQEVIPFTELGFQVVGEAGNGLAALQLCESLQPDLIITDIRMPLMDGLTLCSKVRPLLPAAQFIILSGYDDFEYARQAIQNRAMGYLLKPISADEFTRMLKGAKASLDEAARERSDIKRLRQHFHQSLPTLRESLLTSLLSGGMGSEEALRHAARYEMEIQAPAYAVCMMRVGEEEGPERIDDPELLPFAVMNITDEVLGRSHRRQLFHYNGMIAALLLLEAGDGLPEVLGHVEEARGTAVHYLRCELFVGVSTLCHELSTLPAAARQAVSALDQSVLGGAAHVLCVTDLQRGSSTDLIMDDYQLRQLSNYIKLGEKDRAESLLARLMDQCRLGSPSPKAYQTYLMELFMAFVRMVPEMSLDRDSYDEDFDHLTKAIFRCAPTIDEAQELFLRLLRRQAEEIGDSRRTSGLQLSEAAMGYLEGNFKREDLTLEDLCRHLHVSPSYFSAVFKKETRRTFHQVLTQLRMERALALLSTTDLRTAQVAQEVGLPDPSYFSYSFKKHFGYPPSQARRRQDA
ncbi:MAG: response regulator [Christensenellales bacterium]